jgi:hypothetical protein
MAQAGYTPIQLYHSTTVSNTPTAGNLLPGELAINTADGKLFYEDSGGVVQVIATKAGANGDVVGPASATANNIVLFDGITGKLVKDGSQGLPTGTIVGTSDTQTLTNKRITQRVTSITDAATITPTGDSSDQYNVTALAQPATIAAPSGTPTSGQKLILRIKDNGTNRALTWTTTSGAYRAIGVTLPTTTTANKTVYIGCIYNTDATFWDVVAVATEA